MRPFAYCHCEGGFGPFFHNTHLNRPFIVGCQHTCKRSSDLPLRTGATSTSASEAGQSLFERDPALYTRNIGSELQATTLWGEKQGAREMEMSTTMQTSGTKQACVDDYSVSIFGKSVQKAIQSWASLAMQNPPAESMNPDGLRNSMPCESSNVFLCGRLALTISCRNHGTFSTCKIGCSQHKPFPHEFSDEGRMPLSSWFELLLIGFYTRSEGAGCHTSCRAPSHER